MSQPKYLCNKCGAYIYALNHRTIILDGEMHTLGLCPNCDNLYDFLFLDEIQSLESTVRNE